MNSNTLKNDKVRLAELIAEIKTTYNTDPRWEVLASEIDTLKQAIANQEAWANAS